MEYKKIILDGIEYDLVPSKPQLKWCEENLAVTKFRNEDKIKYAKSDKAWIKAGENCEPAYCYYENDKSKGILYNWYAVNDPRGLAPTGMKIPTIDELMDDSFGTGLPGGLRDGNGYYYFIGDNGYWWSYTEFNTSFACVRNLYFNYGFASSYDCLKGSGLSVRCLIV